VFGDNEGPFGAHAEYLSIPQDGSLATIPANVTYQEAASSTEVRTMPSRTSGRQISGAGRTSSSMAQREPLAQRRSSS
jgi:NADPH:quinone reductase-like Zn-dependent oxidoreductase